MALRGFWGFEQANVVVYPEFTNLGGGAATGRDGVANHACTWNGNSDVNMLIPGGAMSGLIIGQAVNVANFGATTIRYVQFGLSAAMLGFVSVTTDGRVAVYDASSVQLAATAASTMTIGVWRYLEVKWVPSATSSGSCVIRLDGIEVLNYSGVTTTTNSVSNLTFNSRNSMNGVDDMYLLDLTDGTATDGRPNNDFLGDMKVAHLYPTADGATVTMTPSTGTQHSLCVDENPVNTTDYVSGVGGGSSSVRDLYAMADLPGTATTVYGLRVGMYALKSDAGAASLKPIIREPDTTETAGTALPLSTTATGYYGPFTKLKPHAGGVWSPADVNSMQAGAQVA